jgi:hypothetical protein
MLEKNYPHYHPPLANVYETLKLIGHPPTTQQWQPLEAAILI